MAVVREQAGCSCFWSMLPFLAVSCVLLLFFFFFFLLLLPKAFFFFLSLPLSPEGCIYLKKIVLIPLPSLIKYIFKIVSSFVLSLSLSLVLFLFLSFSPRPLKPLYLSLSPFLYLPSFSISFFTELNPQHPRRTCSPPDLCHSWLSHSQLPSLPTTPTHE